MTPLVLQVSMDGGDGLPSGDPPARLPSYIIKKKKNTFILIPPYYIPIPRETAAFLTVVPSGYTGNGIVSAVVYCAHTWALLTIHGDFVGHFYC